MYYIIANPNSEMGRTMFYLPTLTALFDDAGIPYDTHITSMPREAYEKTLKFCRTTKDLKGVIGIGGDGVMQEILAGMAHALEQNKKIPIPLGILPSSTGNDFALSLEGSKQDLIKKYSQDVGVICQDLFNSVIENKTRTIDIATANGMAYLNIGHIGLDVHITKNADELKRKYDHKSYLAATYKSIAKHKNKQLTLNLDDNITEGQYTFIAVANGQYYGGGMRICPSAEIDDGMLTVCKAGGMARLKLMTLFPLVLLEKHTKLKNVNLIHCKKIEIFLPPEPELLCLDGNLYPCKDKIEFEILPMALKIYGG